MISLPRNIVLTGPSGTGKSTVGRILADLLSRPLVDMDQVIEDRMGYTISHCFATRGEAFFRDMESALCRELATQSNLVVASGGGALVKPENREALETNGILVNLNAPVDVLVARLSGHSDRPLLGEDTGALKNRLSTLLEQRRAVYDGVPLQIDTRDRSAEETARAIVDRVLGQNEG